MYDSLTNATLGNLLGKRPFRCYDVVASTQDVARNWALTDPTLPTGAAVIAEQQTAGRGRQGRAWISPPGASLMCSVVVRPTVPGEQIGRLTMAGGIAVAETLTPHLPGRVRLKWPNDVLIEGRKISGILSEATWLGDHLEAVIVGIGVNVRNDFRSTELEQRATCLETELGRGVDRRPLLADLLRRLDHWAERLDDPALVEAWRGWLGTLGRRVTVYPQLGAAYEGVAEAVDEDGALWVRTDAGLRQRVIAADVGLAES